MCHYISSAANAAGTRITSCNNFSEHSQIRVDSVISLGSAEADSEPGNYLICYEEGSVLVGQVLTSFYKVLSYRSCSAFRSNWLDIYSSRASVQLVSLKLLLKVFQISREEFICMPEYIIRNAP